jgi:predicted porin
LLVTSTDGTTASLVEKKEAGLTLGYTIGAFTPKFSYGRVWGVSLDNVKKSGHLNQYVLGTDYALSKRTTAYASYGYVQDSFRNDAGESTPTSAPLLLVFSTSSNSRLES